MYAQFLYLLLCTTDDVLEVLTKISLGTATACRAAMLTFHTLCTNARKGTITKNTLQRIKSNLDKIVPLSFAVKANMNWDSLIQKLNGLCKHIEDILQLYLHLTLHVEGEKLIYLRATYLLLNYLLTIYLLTTYYYLRVLLTYPNNSSYIHSHENACI